MPRRLAVRRRGCRAGRAVQRQEAGTMAERLVEDALDYHALPQAGKLAVVPTKPMATQRDLSLAYSPGVAIACEAIVADQGEAARLTTRGNLVGVVTNGT